MKKCPCCKKWFFVSGGAIGFLDESSEVRRVKICRKCARELEESSRAVPSSQE